MKKIASGILTILILLVLMVDSAPQRGRTVELFEAEVSLIFNIF